MPPIGFRVLPLAHTNNRDRSLFSSACDVDTFRLPGDSFWFSWLGYVARHRAHPELFRGSPYQNDKAYDCETVYRSTGRLPRRKPINTQCDFFIAIESMHEQTTSAEHENFNLQSALCNGNGIDSIWDS